MSHEKNVRLSPHELALLEVVNDAGPCSFEQVHHAIEGRLELLLVMRTMHSLVAKGFLKRLTINNIQLYRTARNYNVKSYLNS